MLGRFQGDPGLIIPIAFLGGLGILAQLRMGLFDFENPFRISQFAYPIGVLGMLFVAILFKNDRYLWLRHFGWLAALCTIALVGAILATGNRFRGALYASGNLTPTEFIKVLVVLFLAAQLSKLSSEKSQKSKSKSQKSKSTSELAIIIMILVFFGALFPLLLWQRDLGMVAILGCLLIVMLAASSVRPIYLLATIVLGTAASFGAYQSFLHSQRRFGVWLDPFSDPTGAGWQLLQGFSGMFSGGLWGAGFGEGNPERIPIAASDFIYAVIGEELGYVGCAAIVFLFLGFFHRALRVAKSTPNPFGALLVVGLATTIALQSFLNIGGVTKTVPLTGIPLPFISHGGSSLLTMFICLGLIVAIADGVPPQIEKPKTKHSTIKMRKRSN